jgi:disulfide bond formation protein DsbB
MFQILLNTLGSAPRRVFLLVSATCLLLLLFGLYLQHVLGLVPCPMCIVQRYALIGVTLLAFLASLSTQRTAHRIFSLLLLPSAGFGGFVAARQSWLQWYPPEVVNCGRDFYGMIETFPLQRLVPMIFKGGGDCTVVDWTFLGGSIANWSFLCFSGLVILFTALLIQLFKPRRFLR